MPDFNTLSDKEIAQNARRLILSDLSVYDSQATLARKTGTSEFALKRAFAKYYGVKLSEYSRKIRMEKAKELLETTNYTIRTIADMLGYSEANNFQASFKTYTGQTPGEWRRKAQEDDVRKFRSEEGDIYKT